MKIRRWQCDEIIVADRARKRIKEDAVLELMKSIQRIGLREPPTIRIEVDDDGCEVAILVAGLRRVEACKRLDLKFIDCVEFKGDQAEARLWEIAENLHRAELTALERAEHLNEWRKLTLEKVAQAGPPDGGLQPDDQGIRKTAKEFGTTRQAIQRAMVIDEGMAPEAKQAAKDAGFDDNQAVLLRIGRENTAEDQIAAVRREQEQVEGRR